MRGTSPAGHHGYAPYSPSPLGRTASPPGAYSHAHAHAAAGARGFESPGNVMDRIHALRSALDTQQRHVGLASSPYAAGGGSPYYQAGSPSSRVAHPHRSASPVPHGHSVYAGTRGRAEQYVDDILSGLAPTRGGGSPPRATAYTSPYAAHTSPRGYAAPAAAAAQGSPDRITSLRDEHDTIRRQLADLRSTRGSASPPAIPRRVANADHPRSISPALRAREAASMSPSPMGGGQSVGMTYTARVERQAALDARLASRRTTPPSPSPPRGAVRAATPSKTPPRVPPAARASPRGAATTARTGTPSPPRGPAKTTTTQDVLSHAREVKRRLHEDKLVHHEDMVKLKAQNGSLREGLGESPPPQPKSILKHASTTSAQRAATPPKRVASVIEGVASAASETARETSQPPPRVDSAASLGRAGTPPRDIARSPTSPASNREQHGYASGFTTASASGVSVSTRPPPSQGGFSTPHEPPLQAPLNRRSQSGSMRSTHSAAGVGARTATGSPHDTPLQSSLSRWSTSGVGVVATPTSAVLRPAEGSGFDAAAAAVGPAYTTPLQSSLSRRSPSTGSEVRGRDAGSGSRRSGSARSAGCSPTSPGVEDGMAHPAGYDAHGATPLQSSLSRRSPSVRSSHSGSGTTPRSPHVRPPVAPPRSGSSDRRDGAVQSVVRSPYTPPGMAAWDQGPVDAAAADAEAARREREVLQLRLELEMAQAEGSRAAAEQEASRAEAELDKSEIMALQKEVQCLSSQLQCYDDENRELQRKLTSMRLSERAPSSVVPGADQSIADANLSKLAQTATSEIFETITGEQVRQAVADEVESGVEKDGKGVAAQPASPASEPASRHPTAASSSYFDEVEDQAAALAEIDEAIAASRAAEAAAVEAAAQTNAAAPGGGAIVTAVLIIAKMLVTCGAVAIMAFHVDVHATLSPFAADAGIDGLPAFTNTDVCLAAVALSLTLGVCLRDAYLVAAGAVWVGWLAADTEQAAAAVRTATLCRDRTAAYIDAAVHDLAVAVEGAIAAPAPVPEPARTAAAATAAVAAMREAEPGAGLAAAAAGSDDITATVGEAAATATAEEAAVEEVVPEGNDNDVAAADGRVEEVAPGEHVSDAPRDGDGGSDGEDSGEGEGLLGSLLR